jgi:hypothetical protein
VTNEKLAKDILVSVGGKENVASVVHCATRLRFLHYAPCKVTEDGYLTLVVLPQGTNEPMDAADSKRENVLLTKKNKFLMVHETQTAKITQGIHPGLKGELREIRPL